MSRLAKKPIPLPEKVTVKIDGGRITATGPMGELTREFRHEVSFREEGGALVLELVRNSLEGRALYGTYASHIKNMLQGVSKGFEKKLIIEGTGYKAKVAGTTLTMALGYSHDIPVTIPDGLKVTVEKDQITIAGIDKEHVGQFAAEIRDLRKPEPYKGKGVRYSDEVIERKQGKKAAA